MIADSYIFSIHQFILCFLVLFFLYFAWCDLKDKTIINPSRVNTSFYLIFFVAMTIGLYFNFLNEWGVYSIILSFGFAILTALSIYAPKYAASFFVFLLISRPWEFYKNELMNSMLRDAFILALLSLLAHRIIKKKFYFQWNLTSTLVFFYGAWTFLTLFAAGFPPMRMFMFNEVFVKNIIVYFLIVNVVEYDECTKPIKTALFLGVTEKALVSAYKVFILKQLGDGASENRMTGIGMIENANDIAAILIIAIPFSLGIFNTIKNFVIRYFFYTLIFAFYIYLIWQAQSRGAILGIGALFVCLYWLKAKNKKIASFIVILGLIGSIGAMSTLKRSSEDTEASTQNRMIFWKAGINMAVRNPLFGVGYEGYIPNLLRYANGNVGTDGTKMTIHSTWLLALAETGFIGFFLYMAIWISGIYSAWKIKYRHPEFILALVSYGVAISFLSHTYMLYPWILLSVTVAAGKFSIDSKNEIKEKQNA